MRSLFLTFAIAFASLPCQAHSDENKIQNESSKNKLVEVILKVPFEDLIINSKGISINYEGSLLTVFSLKKSGDLWIVKASR